jgi:hypothetical protein
MIRKTKNELRLINKKTIKLTDFAIELSNLPDCNCDKEKLKEKLSLFISDLIKQEPDIFGFNDKYPEQIASIHLG